MTAPVTEWQRADFEALADVLIAEGHGKPAASAVSIGGELLDRTLEAVPGLAGPLRTLLDEARRRNPEDFARLLHSERPGDFAVLSAAVAGAYYLSPLVREMIGYPGQAPAPLSTAATPEYVTGGMLERVYDRHPGYRNPTATAGPPAS